MHSLMKGIWCVTCILGWKVCFLLVGADKKTLFWIYFSTLFLFIISLLNINIWEIYDQECSQKFQNFNPISHFQIIQFLVILPKNAISHLEMIEWFWKLFCGWGKGYYTSCVTGFALWLAVHALEAKIVGGGGIFFNIFHFLQKYVIHCIFSYTIGCIKLILWGQIDIHM